MMVGTPLGMAAETLLFATRFRSANDVDEAFDTLMGDERYQELAGSTVDSIQSIEDRFLMVIPS